MELLEKPQKGSARSQNPYCDPWFLSNMPGLDTNVFWNPDGYSTPSVHFDALLAMALNEYMNKHPFIDIHVMGWASAIACFTESYPKWLNNMRPDGRPVYIQDVTGYESDHSQDKLLVKFQPHLQLEELILPMWEGFVCIAQNKVVNDIKRT